MKAKKNNGNLKKRRHEEFVIKGCGQEHQRAFDPDKLGVDFCSAEKGACLAKKAVMKYLKAMARSTGQHFNENGRVGAEICAPRWLHQALRKMRSNFAALIDEDLEKLKQPGADREELVGKVFVHIDCMRAAHFLFTSEDDALADILPNDTKSKKTIVDHQLRESTPSAAEQRLLNIDEEVALLKTFSCGRPFTEAEADRVWKWAIDARIRAMFLKGALQGKLAIHLRTDGELLFALQHTATSAAAGLAPNRATEPSLEDFPPLTDVERQEYVCLRDRWNSQGGPDSFTDTERSRFIELSDRAEVSARLVQSQNDSMPCDDKFPNEPK